MAQRITMRNVDNALPFGYELVKGNGYFYFYGDGEYDNTASWYTSSVMVYNLTQLSIDDWVKMFMYLANKRNQ